MSEAVTVAGGTPTLTLNDGGTATYSGGSGTNALTFSYTVGAGQNTADLAVTAVNLNAATITDGAGNAANLSLSGLTQTGPQIDTTAPTIASIDRVTRERRPQRRQDRHADARPERGGDGPGGTPTLTLNDGGTATYISGSGTNALTFSYTVAAGQNTADLAVTAVNLNGGDHHRRRRQCRQPVAVRPDPGQPADRHHDADRSSSLVESPVERRPRCRQDRDADAQPERGGDGRGRHPDADPQRRRHRDLYRRLRHQRADLQLHGRRRPEHRRPGGDGGQSQRRHHHRRRRQCRQPVAHRPDPDRPADRHHDADGASVVARTSPAGRRLEPARPSR